MNRNTLGSYERGERLPGVDFLAKFAEVFKADMAELVRLRLAAAGITGIKVEEVPPTGRPAVANENAGDFLYLPRYEVKAAAGAGQAVHSEQIVDHLAFRRDWVRGVLGLDPRDLVLIEAVGDSMVPTIRGGDLLLVHVGAPRLASGAVYALGVEDDVLVKRIERRTDGALLLHSDNPAFATEEIAPDRIEQLRIIGRVVWIGRQL